MMEEGSGYKETTKSPPNNFKRLKTNEHEDNIMNG